MPLFRKKPVVIEARQFKNEQCDALLIMAWAEEHGQQILFDGRDLVIPTLEGEMTAQPGDWVIRGVKGEFCPIKDSIFRETYESVD